MKSKYPTIVDKHNDVLGQVNKVMQFRNKLAHWMPGTSDEFLAKNYTDRIQLQDYDGRIIEITNNWYWNQGRAQELLQTCDRTGRNSKWNHSIQDNVIHFDTKTRSPLPLLVVVYPTCKVIVLFIQPQLIIVLLHQLSVNQILTWSGSRVALNEKHYWIFFLNQDADSSMPGSY